MRGEGIALPHSRTPSNKGRKDDGSLKITTWQAPQQKLFQTRNQWMLKLMSKSNIASEQLPMSIFIFFIYLFLIYLFLTAFGLHCCTWAFSKLWGAGATLCWGAQASRCGGFSCCGAPALGVRAQ